ncbi:HutD family protein [Microvirga sp. c23x22]|uniref:HutD family protein n=2 Tax=Microvirga terricola TaxID=2719797 RepID=A0ABX0V7Z5_9HYPH|nr:HutD family protein [Microvirga terricola]
MPWKNGQGLTEEVMAFPAGSSVESFDWRLSIAHVGTDGPFSVFPDIERTIALLDGEGLALDLPEGRTVTLGPGSEPFSFPGDWVISSRNLRGATTDLNMMTRRGRYRHFMRRETVIGTLAVQAKHDALLVFNAMARVRSGVEQAELARWDTVRLEPGERLSVTSEGAVDLFLIDVRPEL